MLVGLVLGVPLIIEFAQTGLVPRFPTAILTVAFGVMGALTWAVGLILDGVLKARRETSRLLYLQYSAPSGARSRAL